MTAAAIGFPAVAVAAALGLYACRHRPAAPALLPLLLVILAALTAALLH
ncbi:hypothetical protein [Streptomyces fradiae]|nr:hypothetical protein [Streptomyces fradiae]WOI58623.1 hypothetical protein RYQ63_00985 [Streptomyces fradiae]